MVGNFRPEDVADAFVKQYYLILNKCPENLHKFYQELSVLGWQGPEGVVTPVTALSDINEKVMSSDYKHCSVVIKTADSQESLEGGIIVAVSGCLTTKDAVKKNFNQTFFLAKQERGFYVLNDILRFSDVSETTTDAAAISDDENDQPATVQNSVSVACDPADSPTPVDVDGPVENGEVEESINGEVEEPIDPSVSKDTLDNGGASDERAVSPATNAKEESVDAPAKKTIVPSAAAPVKKPKVPSAQIPKVPSVVTQPSNVPQKATYASMVAKDTPVASPKAAAVASTVQKQSFASPTAKVPAQLGNGTVKASTPNGTVSKAVTLPSKMAPSPYTEARGIYIGGLPYNITKQGIVDVVKKFGAVRRYSDTVQIRKHEDGFCCGFVEFETPEAARRAVEEHHVMFGEKEAYITYKRSSRGNGGGGRSPTRGGDDRSRGRGPRSSSADQRPSQSR